MKPILLFFLLMASMCACGRTSACHDADGDTSDSTAGTAHIEKRSVYYWKTVLRLGSAERHFLRRHDIGRIYMRLFDVCADPYAAVPEDKAAPNASIRIDDTDYHFLNDSLNHIEVVPVVYITLDALKAMKNHEGMLASNIVTRVRNMASYNGLPHVGEMQLDCDWTASTEQSFFTLCDSVRAAILKNGLNWELSSTIRLHQLARKVPPVDRGVLMVYNTGSFNDPDAVNSIIDPADVEPYMKYLPDYKLHLDVAYPTYSWQLLFHDRKFAGLTGGLNLADSTRFAQRGSNTYVALRDIPYNDRVICRGDMVRQETSAFSDIIRVGDMIERNLSPGPHSTILYHLDISNLSNYSPDEIDKIFVSCR